MERRVAIRALALLALGGMLVPAPPASGEDPSGSPERIAQAVESDQDEPTAPRDARPVDDRDESTPIYRPPRRGAPRTRTAGGLRSGPAFAAPIVLTPDHLARTIRHDPSLFWYIDELPPEEVVLVFTLVEEESIEPMLEAVLERPRTLGIQRIRLADQGVKLVPEQEYEWSVALVVDPEHRSRDLVSTGYIRRVDCPKAFGRGDERLAVETYADLGLWYDALEAASDAIDATPGDTALIGQRDALLRQAGIEAVLQ
jgi:hypothetical protein